MKCSIILGIFAICNGLLVHKNRLFPHHVIEKIPSIHNYINAITQNDVDNMNLYNKKLGNSFNYFSCAELET